MRKPKQKKSTVSVTSDKGMLRLYWRYQGKAEYLYLGYPDSEANRAFARLKASQIETDLISGNYDHSKEKYKPGHKKDSLPVSVLLDKFLKHRAHHVTTTRSLVKYKVAVDNLIEFYAGKDIDASEVEPQLFINWLLTRISGSSVKCYKTALFSIWKHAKIHPNIWEDVVIKAPPKPASKPFSNGEIEAILNALNGTKYHDIILLLFLTGMRIGEALALQKKDFNLVDKTLWIGKTQAPEGVRSAKAFKDRTLNLNQTSVDLLSHLTESKKDDDRIFEWKIHRPIAAKFKRIQAQLKIPYRSIHKIRKSFVSHLLSNGTNPMTVCQITGHSEQVMFKHYTELLNSNTPIPDWLPKV